MADLPLPSTPDGYHTCPACGHHTSAFAGGCTVLVLEDGMPGYCGCDCYKALTGESLREKIARGLHGVEPGKEET